MKVCIASVHFLETTFPLAKHLADNNIEVSVFCLLPFAHRNSNVIDFTDYPVRHGFDNRFNDKVFNESLKKYLNKLKLYPFFFSSLKKKPFHNIIHAIKLALFIKQQKFDIIHFVGSTPFLYYLYILLGKKCNVHTLHEVTVHEGDKSMPHYRRMILNILCKRNIKIILHSNAGKDRLISYYSELKGNKYLIDDRIHKIPFGLFETFNCFSDYEEVIEEETTILFFGIITPYKGITYLLEAFKILKNKIPSIKLIIAGEGKLEDNIDEETNIEFLNRFVSNHELITLIKRAKAVVCPYISASQSGIPMVAFLYGKPVIATSVGGFPEVIEHMKTGVIVPPKDSLALAGAIEEIFTKPEFLNELKNNISTKYLNSSFSWQEIAKRTISVYNQLSTKIS